MTPAALNLVLSGALIMGCWVAGLAFFSFWRQTRDIFFWFFGIAFWLFGLERLIIVLVAPPTEVQPYVYLFRLAGFALLAIGITIKNRGDKS
jgi:hypothetical protein